MTNHTQPFAHPVPSNKFGISMMHSEDNSNLTDDEHAAVINGPISAIEEDLQSHLSRAEVLYYYTRD